MQQAKELTAFDSSKHMLYLYTYSPTVRFESITVCNKCSIEVKKKQASEKIEHMTFRPCDLPHCLTFLLYENLFH